MRYDFVQPCITLAEVSQEVAGPKEGQESEHRARADALMAVPVRVVWASELQVIPLD